MKKNYFNLLLAVAGFAALTGCVNTQPSLPVESVPTEDANDKVLSNAEYTYHVAGQNEVKVDGEWVGNAWDCTDSNTMTAASLNDVKAIDADLFTALSSKSINYLYTIDVRLGVADAGWVVKSMIGDKVYEQNGSYALKAIKGYYDEEDETYIQDLWLPDPHKAHAESLTPETLFIPTWTEAKDENGFSWSDNPVCIGEGGVYTLVVAHYNAVSAADVPGFGFALVLKEAAENGLPHTEYIPPVVESYGVIGSFADNNWSSDVADLVAKDDGTYSLDLEIPANTEFKVRKDDAWDVSFGWDAVANASDLAESFVESGGNIKCLVAGAYTISFDPTTQQLTIAPKAADTYGIIGSFADNNWSSDVADLVANGDGTFSATVEIAANTEFKLRLNDDWTVSYGAGAVANAAELEGKFDVSAGGGSNIKCLVAGTYVITYDPANETITITQA